MTTGTDDGALCPLARPVDWAGVERLELSPDSAPADYRGAMRLAGEAAAQRFRDSMLLSWYDRDRDFESPQHASECHLGSAVPGYVDYGIHHGATLVIDIEQGRFVFFYRDVDLEHESV